MSDFLIKLFGFLPMVFYGDPAVFDRWLWLRKNIKKGSIKTLDAGCGSGAFTIYAAKSGNEAVGVSFNEQNNKKGELRAKILKINKIKFIMADLRKLEEVFSGREIFDQIICFETMEHILNDENLVENFPRLLKRDGVLLLTTPYKYHKALIGDYVVEKEDGGHVRFGYSHEEMEKLLGKFGFEMEVKDYLSGYITQKLINAQSIISEKTGSFMGWLFILPLRIFQIFDSLITRIIKQPYFLIAIVAKKK